MPAMSGAELSDRVRASTPGVKTLYLSGYTENAIVHHGVLDPGVRFLAKPFTGRELLQVVAEVLAAASRAS